MLVEEHLFLQLGHKLVIVTYWDLGNAFVNEVALNILWDLLVKRDMCYRLHGPVLQTRWRLSNCFLEELSTVAQMHIQAPYAQGKQQLLLGLVYNEVT